MQCVSTIARHSTKKPNRFNVNRLTPRSTGHRTDSIHRRRLDKVTPMVRSLAMSRLLAAFAFLPLISLASPRPNIIFILADDLGYGDVGVLHQNSKSGKSMKTPFIDRMASEGMTLDRHYCPAPVCAPSRSSLMSGLHQGHANIRDNQFDKALEDNHNLANTLHAAGYSTALIGKWGLQGKGQKGTPKTWPAFPTKRGFDYFFGFVRHADGHTHYPHHTTASRPPKELYDQDKMIRDDLDLCFTPDLFTARAKKLIADEVNDGDEQPFFLYLAYDTPHAALQIPTVAYPGWNQARPDDDSGLGLNGGVQWLGTPGKMINTAVGEIDSYRHPDYADKNWSDVEVRFATLVRRMDDNIADLRKTLVDLGIAENTLIVFTSDNGPHNESYLKERYSPQSFQSFGPFEGQKRDGWEGGIREPSFAAWPGKIPAGSTNTIPSQFHDWLPTFCELAGVPAPARTDGVSLVPGLLNPNAKLKRTPTTYVEYNNNGKTPTWKEFANHGGTTRKQSQVIFLDGYKGIRNNPKDHQADFQIYDISKDPGESNNLGGKASLKKLQQSMKDTVLRIRQPDQSAPRKYMDATPVPAVRAPTSAKSGLTYQSFTGDWPWMPEFRDLKSTSSDKFTSGIDLSALPQSKDDSGLLITGMIKVPKTGEWTFFSKSDSGSFLRIHEAMVIDDDFSHDGSEVSGTILLEEGLHPIRIYYRSHADVPPALSISWSGPETPKAKIPAKAFILSN